MGNGYTVRDCQVNYESCNWGAIASVGLSIVAGITGLATFATAAFFTVPIRPIVASLLGIIATCIELFHKPPSVRIATENLLKEGYMKKLDTYSKVKLDNSSKVCTDYDLYVANQGHLPKWFAYDQPKNSLEFSLDGDQSRTHSPTRNYHQCSEPQLRIFMLLQIRKSFVLI